MVHKYIKYYKYSTFAFCIGQINVLVPVNKDKYELKLPDPFSYKIYDHTKKELPSVFFTELPFDFMSLIDMLPYRRDTLEEAIADDYRYNTTDYLVSNHAMFNDYNSTLRKRMCQEGSQLRCHNFVSKEREELIEPEYEQVTYVIFIDGTEGPLKRLTKNSYDYRVWFDYSYNVYMIHNIKAIKPSRLVVKNIHYYGAWVKYTGFV